MNLEELYHEKLRTQLMCTEVDREIATERIIRSLCCESFLRDISYIISLQPTTVSASLSIRLKPKWWCINTLCDIFWILPNSLSTKIDVAIAQPIDEQYSRRYVCSNQPDTVSIEWQSAFELMMHMYRGRCKQADYRKSTNVPTDISGYQRRDNGLVRLSVLFALPSTMYSIVD